MAFEKARDGEREAVIDLCLACGPICREHLAGLRDGSADWSTLQEKIRCVALLTAIADRLAHGQECPASLLEVAIDLAEGLPRDGSACWRACQEAAEAIGDLIDTNYENGY